MGQADDDADAACRKAMKKKKALTKDERARLAEKLIGHGDRGGGRTWIDLMQEKIDAYGVDRPEVTVVYKDLTVTTRALVGTASIPTVLSPLIAMGRGLLCMGRNKQEKELNLVDHCSGVFKPGRMTLLLGPPSSGKSTFMKTLSGRLKESSFMKVSGDMWFNGKPPSEFQHTNSVTYVAQIDNHEPNLTVQETLDFAYLCLTGLGDPEFNLPAEICKKKRATAQDPEAGHNAHGHISTAANSNHQDHFEEISSSSNNGSESPHKGTNGAHQGAHQKGKVSDKKAAVAGHGMDHFDETLRDVWGSMVKVDVVSKLLGVFHTRDTVVGNELLRGISGGEKKRLTTAEQLLSRRCIWFLDEISTGLDSATLFTVIRWLSKWCHAMHITLVISLLQPPPEVFQLFDDVLIFTEGHELYHGPVRDAVPFFASLGFDCPTRKDIPSFLLEVTTAKGQLQYANQTLRAAHGLPPVPSEGESLERTTLNRHKLLVPLEDIRKAFWTNNEHGKIMAKEVESLSQPQPIHAGALVLKSGYPLTPIQAIMVATKRQATLVFRDRVLLKGRLMQVIVISLISSSLYYQLPVSIIGARSFFGLCFLMVLFMNFGGFPQLPLTIEAKKVWFKHRSNHFIPAYAQGLAMAIAQLPLSVIEASVFSPIMYFMVGMYATAGNFFTFWVITFTLSLTASSLFRFLGCVCPNVVIANAAGGITLVILIISSGFAILRYDIPNWMIWAYWLSPFAWALRAFSINEMMTPKWNDVPFPGQPDLPLGEGALLQFGFFTERYWIWFDIIFMLGAFAALTTAAILALMWQKPEQPRATMTDEEAVAAARATAEAHRQSLAAKREAAGMSGRIQSTRIQRSNTGEKLGTSARFDKSSSNRHVMDVEIDIASSLEFTPITLVFKDICYTVPNPGYDRRAARAAAKAKVKAAQTEGDSSLNGAGQVQLAAAGSTEVKHVESKASVVSAESVIGQKAAQQMATQEKLHLLTDITGYAEPGVLMALMGGSGAGKTTLMDCLAGRKTVGEIKGDIFVNGHPKEQRSWSRVVGYCEQNDIHIPLQNVKDALLFSARLRLPTSVSNDKVVAYVDEVMDIVDLIDIQYNLVGQPGMSGLSVEQRKRLTIAVELVANPSVVFMDEPTSGLDARAAAIVMQAVRNVARNGRTVMVTIHQPSIEIFEAFDKLLLIQRGGRTTYFGPLGEHSEALISYLKSVPGTPDLMPGYNPATWMLEVTGGSMATLVEAVDVCWPDVYASSALCHEAREYADWLVEEAVKEGTPQLTIASQYAQPFRVQLLWCMKRSGWSFWHNPPYNFIRYALTFITSWIYAAMYWKQGAITSPATIANVQAVMGVMYSATNFMGMINMMSVMPIVGYERVVFYRERGASMYNPFAYGIAMALVEVPYLIVQAIVFVPTIYWMIHFVPTAQAFFYYFIMFTETIAFYSIFGQFLVYVTPSQAIAQVLGGSLNFLFNIFNGFVITYPDMPKGWRWLNRVAPSTWIMYGLGISQLNRPDVEIVYNNQSLTLTQFMEQRFGYYASLQWWCLLIVLAYIVFLRVTSVLALRYWNFLRR